ncbi:uncharacterized protein LOC110456466 [Mizuhopecten yessoensis]|uniref:C-type lectin domain-containing protein n=1 Tax=Mizuhopecten yessoensis TaxID=6573 RepID=A0A210QAX1_MIZYE|nr:uncharacterized protein LOC110456466 [Mizuhopecten yessoensis]OWF45873.1 hypothetical protein KP79_PYT07270 [Mizuhopecten yessoensis]
MRTTFIEWIVCTVLWGLFGSRFISGTHDLDWCEFEFHMNKLDWAGAHAVCRETNKKLARINGSSQHAYLTSLFATSMSLIAVGLTVEPTFWIGLHHDAQGSLRWAGCDEFTSQADYGPVVEDAGPGCFLLDTRNTQYTTEACQESKHFLCQADDIDVESCFTLTHNVADMTYVPQATYRSKTYSSDCFDLCTGPCLGFKHDTNAHKCSMMLRGIGGKSGQKGVLYIKGLLKLDDHGDVSAPYLPSDFCSEDISDVTSTSSDIMVISSVDPSSSCWLESSGSESSELQTSSRGILDSSHSETPQLSTTDGGINTSPSDTDTGMCSTSSAYVSTSTSLTCYCPCGDVTNTTITPKQLESKINEIKQTLTVSKKATSSWKRKLVSTPDDRVSAQSIGYIGAAIMCSIAAIMIIMDLPRLGGDFKRFVRSVFSSRVQNFDTDPLPK